MVNCFSWDCANCWARIYLEPPNFLWGRLQQPTQLSPALAWRITHSAAIRCLSLSLPNVQISHLPTLLISMASTEPTPSSTSSITSPAGEEKKGGREEEGGVHLPWYLIKPVAPKAANKASSALSNIMQFFQEDILKSWKATREDCCRTESYSMPTAPACHCPGWAAGALLLSQCHCRDWSSVLSAPKDKR